MADPEKSYEQFLSLVTVLEATDSAVLLIAGVASLNSTQKSFLKTMRQYILLHFGQLMLNGFYGIKTVS